MEILILLSIPLLPLLYRSTFLQHDAPFLCFYYLYSCPIFHLEEKLDLSDDKSKMLFLHSSQDFSGVFFNT